MIFKGKNNAPGLGLMLGITLPTTSILTSCSKDSSVTPSATDIKNLDKNPHTGSYIPPKNTPPATRPPATTPPVTTPPVTTSPTTKFAYQASAPISLSGQSNITISGDLINSKMGEQSGSI